MVRRVAAPERFSKTAADRTGRFFKRPTTTVVIQGLFQTNFYDFPFFYSGRPISVYLSTGPRSLVLNHCGCSTRIRQLDFSVISNIIRPCNTDIRILFNLRFIIASRFFIFSAFVPDLENSKSDSN